MFICNSLFLYQQLNELSTIRLYSNIDGKSNCQLIKEYKKHQIVAETFFLF